MSDRHRATEDGNSVIPAQAGLWTIVSDLLDARGRRRWLTA